MTQLLGLSKEQVAHIRPLFLKERDEAGGRQEGVKRHHPCHSEGAALDGCPGRLMVPTKPSTTVAAAGETRVFLI